MYILKLLLDFITYPVEWFWVTYEKNKTENNLGKNLLLFVGSFIGLFTLAGLVIWLFVWLITNKFEFVIFAILIGWLYSYIRKRIFEKLVKNEPIAIEQQNPQQEAERMREYYILRNIIYQVSKTSADSIGCISPRVLEEVQVEGTPYNVVNNICFYSFRLRKSDINSRYSVDELQEFARILENDISYRISCGMFPTLAIQNTIDEYGTHPAICIDVIEDLDSILLIQAVFYTPAYAVYLHNKKLNQQLETNNILPDEKW